MTAWNRRFVSYRRSRPTRWPIALLAIWVTASCRPSGEESDTAATAAGQQNVLVDLWERGLPAFGVFVPNETPPTPEQRRGEARPPPTYTAAGGTRLAENPLYDFVFLNLEGSYDSDAVRNIAEGLRAPTAVSRKTLLVRIPSVETAGADLTGSRVKEVLDMGADGVVLPHVRGVAEAELVVEFFANAGADVWSPANPEGTTIAMIMVKDPVALAEVAAIADVPGYSVLACGIGSLTRALGGDREAAEAGNQRVLAESKRVGVADMITANAQTIERRVGEGFLALLMQGPSADEVITTGRAAAGR